MKIESPRDMKIEARRFRTLTLYLSGAYTQEEIAEIEGVDRKTARAPQTRDQPSVAH